MAKTLYPQFSIVFSKQVASASDVSSCDLLNEDMLTLTPGTSFISGLPYLTSLTVANVAEYITTVGVFPSTLTVVDGAENSYVLNGAGAGLYNAISPVPIDSATFTVNLIGFTYTMTDGTICTNDILSASIDLSAVIVSDPIASFTRSITGLALDVDATASVDHSGGGLTYAWDYGDGVGTDTGVTPVTYNYTATGTYSVSLTVTDGNGATNTIIHSVIAAVVPVPVQIAPVLVGSSYNLDGTTSTSSDADSLANEFNWIFIDFITGAPIGQSGFGTTTQTVSGYSWLTGQYGNPTVNPNALLSAFNSVATVITVRLQVKDDQGNTSTAISDTTIFGIPSARWSGDTANYGVNGTVAIAASAFNFAVNEFALAGSLENSTSQPFTAQAGREVRFIIEEVGGATLATISFAYSAALDSTVDTPSAEAYDGAKITNWADLQTYFEFTVTTDGKVAATFDKFNYADDHSLINKDTYVADAAVEITMQLDCLENSDTNLRSASSTATLPFVSTPIAVVDSGYIAYSTLNDRIYQAGLDRILEYYNDGSRVYELDIAIGDFSSVTVAPNQKTYGIAAQVIDRSGGGLLHPDIILNIDETNPPNSTVAYRSNATNDWAYDKELGAQGPKGRGMVMQRRLTFFSDHPIIAAQEHGSGYILLDVMYRNAASTYASVALINSDQGINEMDGLAIDNDSNIYYVGEHRVGRLKFTVVTTEDPDVPSTWTAVGTGFVKEDVAGLQGTAGTTLGVGSDARFNTPKDIVIIDENYNNLSYPRMLVSNSGGNNILVLTPTQNTATPEDDYQVAVFAGSLTQTSGSDDGIGTLAKFDDPQGMDVDPGTGDVYVRDDNGLRKIEISGATVTVSTVVSYDNTLGLTERYIF